LAAAPANAIPKLEQKFRRYNAQGIGVASLLIHPPLTTLLLWDVGHREECPVSTDQYWQYAREAMLSVGHATNDEERRDLLELARDLDASGNARESASYR
jgi:hypothetical protein